MVDLPILRLMSKRYFKYVFLKKTLLRIWMLETLSDQVFSLEWKLPIKHFEFIKRPNNCSNGQSFIDSDLFTIWGCITLSIIPIRTRLLSHWFDVKRFVKYRNIVPNMVPLLTYYHLSKSKIKLITSAWNVRILNDH